jgi:ATP-binding cassette subfamily B protein/subfamily B ATP-binding cassette protein MsbA
MRLWWLRLSRFAIPELPRLAVVGLVTTGIAGLGALKPWPLKLAVDDVLLSEPAAAALPWLRALPGGGSSAGLLVWLAAGTLLLFLASSGLTLVQDYVRERATKGMIYRLGLEAFDNVQNLSLSFHGRHRAGDLMERVLRDSRCVQDLVVGVFLPAATSVLTLLMMFVVMWRLDPMLAMVTSLFALPLGLMGRHLYEPVRDLQYVERSLQGETTATAEESFSSLPMVQSFGREALQDGKLRDLTGRTLEAHLRVVTQRIRFTFGGTAVTALGTAVVIALAASQTLNGSLTVGGLLVFLAYVNSFYGPMTTLAFLSESLGHAAAKAKRVLEILDTAERVEEKAGARKLERLPLGRGGHVRLEGVTFGYEANRPVLHDVSLEVRPGEVLGVVGATGSGKSTLVSLIPRFFDPWEGRVLFDGADVRDVQLSGLRDQVSLVLQEPFLLAMSVADNIAYGRPGASREEIIAAAEAAQADRFIRELPNGYDTVIGERGATLSGGQRQRVAIARALLKDAPVLILDEPTSALDAETEDSLLDALDRLMEGRTTFVVAHRLSTIRRADRIVVIEGGRVVEEGPAEALLAAQGRYHQLLRLQTATVGSLG